MAKFSREKGRRGEQQLVLYLAKLGYKAERILNQAHTAGLPDVKAVKQDKTFTFELKTYRDGFKTIYDFYYGSHQLIVGAALAEDRCVAISTDFEALVESPLQSFRGYGEGQKRLYERLYNLNKMRGSADFLVLKDNNKARLFLRYIL